MTIDMTSGGVDKSARVKAVIQSYCDAFPEQAQRVVSLTRAAETRSNNQFAMLKELHTEVHRMAGSAHCVGFREIGRELSRIETKISALLNTKINQPSGAYEAVVYRILKFFSSIKAPQPEQSRLIERNLIAPRIDEPNAASASAIKIDLAEKRVLIIDDDIHVRQLVDETLRLLGVSEVLSLASGLEAIVAFPDFQPDIIVTDWHMHPITGPQLLDMVRSGETVLSADTPIVFFSNTADRKRRMQVEMSGANRFLTKPVSPEILNKTLLNALSTTAH